MANGIFAFLADDPDWLGSILVHRPTVLADAARQSGRWHLVFYQDGDVLLRTHPGGSGDVDRFLSFLMRTRTRAMLGHFDPPQGKGAKSPSITCRAMGWAYTQLGETPGFDRVRDRIRDALPSFIARTMVGSGEAEHIFHLVLAFLHDSGKLDNHDLPASEVASGVRHALMMLEQIYPVEGLALPRWPMVVTNGFSMAGWSGSTPLPTAVFFRPEELEGGLHRGVGSSRESGEIPLYPRNGRRAVLLATFLDSSYPDSITGQVRAESLFGVTRSCEIQHYPR